MLAWPVANVNATTVRPLPATSDRFASSKCRKSGTQSVEMDVQDLDGKVDDPPSPSRAASRTSVQAPSPNQSSSQAKVRWQDVPDALAELAVAAARSATAHRSRRKKTRSVVHHNGQRGARRWLPGDLPSGNTSGSPGTPNVAQLVSSILSQKGGLQLQSSEPSSVTLPPDPEHEARGSLPGNKNTDSYY